MTMSPWSAIRTGFSRIGLHKRLVLWLYLCNVAFAGVLLFPFRNVIGKIGKSDLSHDFVSGFSLDSFIDFLNRHTLTLQTLGYAALGLGVVYLLLYIFLTAEPALAPPASASTSSIFDSFAICRILLMGA